VCLYTYGVVSIYSESDVLWHSGTQQYFLPMLKAATENK